VRGLGEQAFDGFNKAFLTIGQKDEGGIDEVVRREDVSKME
jgi:hypothetical protein